MHLLGFLVAAKETPVDAEKENNFPFNIARTTHTPPILPVIMLHQHVRVLNAVFMKLFSQFEILLQKDPDVRRLMSTRAKRDGSECECRSDP